MSKAFNNHSVPPPVTPAPHPKTDFAFGRTVVPVPLKNKPTRKDRVGFEYAEHGFIGDAINLTLANGTVVVAANHNFTLKNGLVVTYGQINGLAGDFYGTDKPISDGSNPQDQATRFSAAYSTLADASSRQPKEAYAILGILQAEVDAVNKALQNHENPSIVYSQLPDETANFEYLTIGRPSGFPSYLGLAAINWDHFGPDARTAYNAGHTVALQAAAAGNLEYAYTLNAFADHFLEDSFSAGHLRTPRRGLHSSYNPTADVCAKYMHDEDNAIGLSVKNPAGETWTCYGDKRALDDVDADNLKRCIAAIQASANEIYNTFKTKSAPLTPNFKAWTYAPTLASALGPQTLGPLFKYKDGSQDVLRRKVIENRYLHDLIGDWWFASTAAECASSGWWTYPITISGPVKTSSDNVGARQSVTPGLAFGRTVVPVPLKNKPTRKDRVGFEYAEHGFIGDAITLTLADGSTVVAANYQFALSNGLVATYGQINGLAGDFYGTDKPISDGPNAQDQAARFSAAYGTLANPSSRQPQEAQAILGILQAEVDAVNKALQDHENPSIVYSQLPDQTANFEYQTIGRPSGCPSYLGLAAINWDHFGPDARTAYNAGHTVALQAAAAGNLLYAYTLNAFADHFLEDSFSAGHLRTPRRGLHSSYNPTADVCAKYMHDEDNAIGLVVQNSAGDSWCCYGDKRALDDVDADNLKRCVAAVQASADEIYHAFKTKSVPPPSSFKVWSIAATLASALGPQTLGPLFKYQDGSQDVLRRTEIENRYLHDLTGDWWFATTAAACAASGWWTYPITINGPSKKLEAHAGAAH